MKSISELFNLKGKCAVVTGGATGVGEAISLRLAEAGAGVMIVDLNEEAASRVVEGIKSQGGKARCITANVALPEDTKKAAAAAAQAFGGLDILVNNASIYPPAPILDLTEESWDKVININLKGMYFCAQAAASEMIKAGKGGKIINISSIESLHPVQMHVSYASSKGGVNTLTKSLALELAPHKIFVNAIAPGTIWTPGLEALLKSYAEPFGMTIKQLLDATVYPRVPLGRLGDPDDIAKVALFLSSGAADYMTGELIVVDGGYLLT